MLWLEVMEGKERMREKKYTKEYGITASCVMRGVEHLEKFKFVDCTDLPSLQPRLFFADSWFGSVKAVCQVRKLGHYGCFMIKTAHFFLEEKMQHFQVAPGL